MADKELAFQLATAKKQGHVKMTIAEIVELTGIPFSTVCGMVQKASLANFYKKQAAIELIHAGLECGDLNCYTIASLTGYTPKGIYCMVDRIIKGEEKDDVAPSIDDAYLSVVHLADRIEDELGNLDAEYALELLDKRRHPRSLEEYHAIEIAKARIVTSEIKESSLAPIEEVTVGRVMNFQAKR